MPLIDRFYSKIVNNLSLSKKNFYLSGEKKISYNELFKNIKKINFYLQNFKNKKVGLYCEKSDLYYAAVIAILLSGNTWIQIPKNNPKERNRHIVNESKIHLIIGDEKIDYIKKKITQIKFKQIIKKKNSKELRANCPFNENDVACIFFTSGSTGEPKGVKISYLNMISCLEHQIDNLKYKKNDVFSDFHDSAFVMSLVTILPCLYVGGSIVPFTKDTDKILASEIIRENKVNVLITVPSFMMVLNYQIKKKLKIDKIVLCGESFSLNVFKIVKNKFNFKKLFNFYGATELSPWAFYYEYESKDLKDIFKMGQVPIGKPFQKVFVKSNKLKELLISGDVVSEGYLENKLNKLKFINFNKIKFYNTGDLFTIYKKNYYILGRNDKQIKVYGYRVNLLEIDVNLRKLDKINFSLTFFKNNSISTIYNSDNEIEEKKLENYLKQNLPKYMLPKKYFYIKKIKFNKNGKIDRDYLLRKFK